ncbi:ABC transporter ATP-binding protein [Geodermatophilus ruber]|uniref:NitT/TauT family transport system ATP-binding protein n=1 Tax=Geodermatophilus ruber TaxID=504800 RepID=A0A1I4C7H5_9ACTN|nr:ABC transporter ATP-binding protein [Geodermatophilus ruber]SFK77064.1 NitT/TauT family transport system ATP-binding protein [Geodermatophilus ruber]
MSVTVPMTATRSAVDAMLQVEGITHVYGQGATAHRAIENLSFTVGPREFVSIVGPSGAGKTTLLRILSGLLTPTEGTVSLVGEPVDGVPEGMAMVFQDYSRSLLPWLSIEKNVMFPLTRTEAGRDERRRIARESLEAVGLADRHDRYPWQLSGGMQQRVAIARALAYRPRLLLMDEPFASVDAQTRSDLEDLVLSLRDRYDMTILFVTHDIDESVYLADRVLVLSRPPAHLVEEIPVPIPHPRDQITTKETDEFVDLRGRVARLIRSGGQPDGGGSR